MTSNGNSLEARPYTPKVAQSPSIVTNPSAETFLSLSQGIGLYTQLLSPIFPYTAITTPSRHLLSLKPKMTSSAS